MSELVKRIIVAVFGIPIAIFIVYMGTWYLTSMILVISAIGLWEFYKIAEKKHSFPNTAVGIAISTILILIFQIFNFFEAVTYAFLLIISATLFIMLLELWHKKPNSMLNIIVTLAGLLYIPLSFIFLLLTRNLFEITQHLQTSTIDFISINNTFLMSSYESAGLLLSIFISIWVCDSGAYFTGKAIGKHKLFERISPKKTWEGAIGGFVFAILGFWGATEFFIQSIPVQHVIVIGIIAGVFGQLGDLAESQLKRDAGVKDSSAILPGHGGILDRFDSILFVVPIVFIYLFLNIIHFNF